MNRLMRNTALVILCSLVISLTFAQKTQARKATKKSPFQGICGTVIVKRGNFMPSPDRPARTGQPAEREVLIFSLLNKSQVDVDDDGFVNSVRDAKPVRTVKSDKNGKFCVSLPVGQYSVLVQEPKGLYANLFDAQNNIFPVNIQKNRRSEVRIEITHQAVF